MELNMQLEQSQNRIEIPCVDDIAVTRHVRVGPLRILMWDTYTSDHYHRTALGYAVWLNDEPDTLFVGDDLFCPTSQVIDSDKTVCSLIAFLTLRESLTDPDYFDNYTPEQREWADSTACDELACDLALYEELARTGESLTGSFIRDLEV
jgi:hypothetical protein